MADQTPDALTPQERQELEALREEKARREADARAAAERRELEELRAEQERIDAEILRERAAQQRAASPTHTTSSAQSVSSRTSIGPSARTFGQRMVMTPPTEHEDDIPGMPPAQKIVVALALLLLIAGAVYIWTVRSGMM